MTSSLRSCARSVSPRDRSRRPAPATGTAGFRWRGAGTGSPTKCSDPSTPTMRSARCLTSGEPFYASVVRRGRVCASPCVIRPIVTRLTAIAGVMLTEGSPSAAPGRRCEVVHEAGAKRSRPYHSSTRASPTSPVMIVVRNNSQRLRVRKTSSPNIPRIRAIRNIMSPADTQVAVPAPVV